MLVKASSQDYDLKIKHHELEGPASPRDYLEWSAKLKQWRSEQQAKKDTQVTSAHEVSSLEVSPKWQSIVMCTQNSFLLLVGPI